MQSYRLETWRISNASGSRLVMRPTPATALSRLGITLVCLLIVAALGYSLYETPKPGSRQSTPEESAELEEIQALGDSIAQGAIERGMMTQEEVDAIHARSDERIAKSRERLVSGDSIIRTIIIAGIYLFGFLAVLAPISALWERVRIDQTVRGEFRVRRRDSIGWPSKKRYAPDTFNMLLVTAREHQEGTRKSGYRTVGWMWEIMLQGQDQLSGMRFAVDLSPSRPLENKRLPEKVATVANAISRFTGCRLQPGYTVSNLEATSHGPFSTKKRYSGKRINLGTKRSEHRSLDELPPDIRAEWEAAQARGETGPIRIERSHTIENIAGNEPITYRGPDGIEHTYNSIDEMPPELQELFKRFKK